MVNINIEIPDDLHKKIKLISVMQDMTIKQYIIRALEQKTKKP